MYFPNGKPFNPLLGQKTEKNLRVSFLPFLYSFVKFSKKPRKVTPQTQNIALAYQKTINIWFPRWCLMRKWFANKFISYFKIGKKWWKSISFLYVDFDNRERVSWHQIRFYIKWWASLCCNYYILVWQTWQIYAMKILRLIFN